MRSLARGTVKLAFLGAVAGTIGYFAGYPPPTRFIVDTQSVSFSRFKDRCEKPDEYSSKGSYRHNLGDSLLSRELAIERAKILCAETLFRLDKAPLDVLEDHVDELKEMRRRIRARGEGLSEKAVLDALGKVDLVSEHARYIVKEIAATSDYPLVRQAAEKRLKNEGEKKEE